MNSLVSYASSDSEGDVQSERPAKIAKTEALIARSKVSEANQPSASVNQDSNRSEQEGSKPTTTQPHTTHSTQQQPLHEASSNRDLSHTEQPNLSNTPIGPSIPTDPSAASLNIPNNDTNEGPSTATPTASAPQSPYTTTRETLHDLTLPTHPNFSIPESPSPPASPDSLAAHAGATKKFAKFLELKRPQNQQNHKSNSRAAVHFHERLLASSALRNPGMVGRLMEFAGVSEEERYAGTLPIGDGDEEGGGVPVKWGEGWYIENLLREAERRRKKAERKKGEDVQFVAAATAGGGGGAEGVDGGGGGGGKKSPFDQR